MNKTTLVIVSVMVSGTFGALFVYALLTGRNSRSKDELKRVATELDAVQRSVKTFEDKSAKAIAELEKCKTGYQDARVELKGVSEDLGVCRAGAEEAQNKAVELQKQLADTRGEGQPLGTIPEPLSEDSVQSRESEVPEDGSMTKSGSSSQVEDTIDLTAADALANGDGHDWKRLSTRTRLELGLLCVKTTGRHTGWTYVSFIDAFYRKATLDDSSLLDMSIAELAAVAAALEIED